MVLHRSSKVAAAVSILLFPIAAACSLGSSHGNNGEIPEVAVGQDQPIITGSKDTGHPAVVLLQMTLPGPSYALCTGTIIKTNPATSVGYVLTAGHCVRNATSIQVIAGSDLSSSTGISSYAFVDATSHPQYDGQTSSPYDVAMVRILGVDADTPVVPVLGPDQMEANRTRVTSVGFGQTVRPSSPVDAGMNTAKNQIGGTVTRLTAQQMGVTYDNNGDICHGDSGGPVLTTVSGKEYVAGVHSFVTGPCVGQGYSVRASSQVDFYNSVIAKAAPAETCELCRKRSLSGTQVCAVERGTCMNDEQCGGLAKCLSHCSSQAGDAGVDCQHACVAQFPYGTAPYQKLVAYCSCNECESACAGDTQCAAVPKCGIKFADASCNSCMESACCAEESACSGDGHCGFCMKNPNFVGAAECVNNAQFQAVRSCRATKCTTECPQP